MISNCFSRMTGRFCACTQKDIPKSNSKKRHFSFICFFSVESANIIKPLIFLVQKSCIFKIKSYLCNAFNKSTSERKFGRGGRVVDCGGLENRCTARYPGFESLSLRKNRMQMKENPCKLTIYGDFLFLVHSKNKHIKAFFRCTIRCTLLPSMSGTPIW